MPVTSCALSCAVLVTLSVVFIDRPVMALVVHNVFNHRYRMHCFDLLAVPSLLPLPCACVFLVVHALRSFAGQPPVPRAPLYLRLSVAVIAATVLKDQLKWLIGRPWPGTWVKYGIYTLHPFRDDHFFGSFPSGHTTYIAAPMFVLWWCMPKYRPLWLALIVMVMIGLVGSGHHFVGDVVAGFFLGLAVATGTVAAWPDGPGLKSKNCFF